MTLVLSALAFFILLTLLILIHELGHFSAARRAKVIVEEFGFGLPPKLKTVFRQGGTNFTLNWIPFGGFVRLKGENAVTPAQRRAKGSFAAASYFDRIVILVAGVFMNFVLAIVLLTYGFSFGQWIPTFTSIEQMERASETGIIAMELGVLVEEVVSGSPAAVAGVPERSVLTHVEGEAITYSEDVIAIQEGKSTVEYSVLTGEQYDVTETYAVDLEDGKAGVVLSLFPRELSSPRRSVTTGFVLALRETSVVTVQTVKGIGRLLTSVASSGRVPEGITGIVGIAQLTHSTVQEGWSMYLRLVALLSLSLAVLNILPFPALDGGRLLFVLAEMVRRKPLNHRVEMLTNAIGFGFLLLLILLITFYDIIRLF